VGWAYLIDVLMALGFGQKWRNWVCPSLASATSRVLLNGDPGPLMAHEGIAPRRPAISYAIHPRH
jgi:hypothetical protein